MRRGLWVAGALTLLLLSTTGCTDWQASKSSQAVDVNPFAIGSGEPVVAPSNDNRYINGEPLDMRTRR
jgi:hypothetical protein